MANLGRFRQDKVADPPYNQSFSANNAKISGVNPEAMKDIKGMGHQKATILSQLIA
jgi:hypothetical protein